MNDYDYEKMRELVADVTDNNSLSNCCGAPIIMEDICSDCKEHCEPQNSDEE